MEFDDDNICMGCRMSDMKLEFSKEEWGRRKQLLVDLFEKTRCPNGSRHDCIIPVSGGKDSHFQVHYIKNVLGYNPLLITYYGNNFSPVGERNLYAMKERFGVDHLIYYPSIETLKKLNRLGLTIMGDMNWHNHVGAASVTMRAAVENGIPLVIWGEHGYADLAIVTMLLLRINPMHILQSYGNQRRSLYASSAISTLTMVVDWLF